jgi:hypothetical protein
MDKSNHKRAVLSSLTANQINQQRDQRQQQKQQNDSRDCKKLIKGFSSSNTKEFSLMENRQLINDPSSRHSGHSSSTPSSSLAHNYNYEINFPPGPMNLQFEPCINHQIGCKVQSLLFEKDNRSEQKKSHLQKIQVGHVVTTIDGIDVIFLSFTEIMKLLDQRYSVHKNIGFKITANAALLCPPTPLTPTHSLVSETKPNTPTTPKNVKFRSPLIPSSSSSVSSSPPLSPQSVEQDVSNYSMTSTNHLSAYSLTNSVLENSSETPLSSPLHHLSEASLKRESFTSRTASAGPLPQRNQLRSPKEVTSFPSPPPPPPHLTPDFEEKYRQLLQDLAQSYLRLQEYQSRVEILEDHLRVHRENEENEKKKSEQIYEQYLFLEKGMDGMTQLRGEEIADRDAWMSRAIAAEKIIHEQKIQIKNKLIELKNSYERNFQEISEEKKQITLKYHQEIEKFQKEIQERNKKEEFQQQKCQEDLEKDHQERLEMIQFYEKERIEKEEEKEQLFQQNIQLKTENQELKRKFLEISEVKEEVNEKYLNVKREMERKEREWKNEIEVRVEEEKEIRNKVTLLQEENEIYKKLNWNLEKEINEKNLKQQNLIRELEEKYLNFERRQKEEEEILLKRRQEEKRNFEEIIFKLEKEKEKTENDSKEVERKFREISLEIEKNLKVYEVELRERDHVINKLREECVNVERESRSLERELRNHFIRIENEKRQIESEYLESQQKILQLQLFHQEQLMTIGNLEVILFSLFRLDYFLDSSSPPYSHSSSLPSLRNNSSNVKSI